MCIVSQKQAMNEYFVHTDTDLVGLKDEDAIGINTIAKLNKQMTDLVHTLHLLQDKEAVHTSAENKMKIDQTNEEIARIDLKIRSIWKLGDPRRTMAEFDLVKTDFWPLGPSEYFVHTDTKEAVDEVWTKSQYAEKEAIIMELQKNATSQEALFHTAYAHVLAAMDCLVCFENIDYKPIITVLEQYQMTMPQELVDTTMVEKIAIKKRMAPKKKI